MLGWRLHPEEERDGARDLIEMVQPDHEFRLLAEDRAFRGRGPRSRSNAPAGGGPAAGARPGGRPRARPRPVLAPMTRSTSWSAREMLDHILGQEIDVEDVLRAIEEAIGAGSG